MGDALSDASGKRKVRRVAILSKESMVVSLLCGSDLRLCASDMTLLLFR